MPGSDRKQLLHILQAPVSVLFFFHGGSLDAVGVNISSFWTLSGQINLKLVKLDVNLLGGIVLFSWPGTKATYLCFHENVFIFVLFC